jgi:hypothetical protein
MNFVGEIVGRLAFRAFLCCFQKSKASNGGALRQHRVAEAVMFTGSSPVRSAIITPRKSMTCGAFFGLSIPSPSYLSVFCRCLADNRALHPQSRFETQHLHVFKGDSAK